MRAFDAPGCRPVHEPLRFCRTFDGRSEASPKLVVRSTKKMKAAGDGHQSGDRWTQFSAWAVTLFLLNIIGMGLGPQGVGIVSDLLSDRFGSDSLRYALAIFGMVNIWAAYHYWEAGRCLAKGDGKDGVRALASRA